uniref:Protein CIP2A homolog n=1 Tax=Saccoglossus kowalevskii TaxID=10224 RepID=A0ABM0MS05_SACKO|nr:PREDICTED: protein CIP2A homolog [Saccoglossus kowalevskii]
MDVYEHKLASLSKQDGPVQDLLEAKAMALAQADRLISQNLCKIANLEAEARKLRSLLQDVEKQNEEYCDKVNDMQLKSDRSTKEMEQLIMQNQHLQVIAKEYEQLTVQHKDLTQRFTTTNRNLKTKEEDYVKLQELYDMLQRHNEKLGSQHEVATERLAKLEEERKSLTKLLKDKEKKCCEQKDLLSKQDKEGKKLKRELENADATIEQLREDLNQNEKEFRKQTAALEKQNREKDDMLSKMKSEMEKQSQIAKMIHNLTSGKQ